MIEKWKLEDDVNDYVKNKFSEIGFKKLKDYNVESSMSEYMKDALKGSAKTKTKTNFGKPDFHVEKYDIPVIFEDKLGIKKLIAKNKDGIKDDEKSIQNFATNGAIHYATQIIASGKYKEAVAIGVAGDHKGNVVFDIYYVFGSSFKSIKKMENYTSIDFLENEKTFSNFYNDCVLTEEEKHEILITSRTLLQKYARELNKLMHNHNITAPQRVLYVSGMLLSMQDIVDEDGNLVQRGLIPEDLLGAKTDTKRDGIIITNQIKEYLKQKQIRQEKVELMLSSFTEISKDNQRDEPTDLDKLVGKLLEKEASTNKQIFSYIFNNIYMSIDGMAGHLDIMGEMYSEFLKYALGDGKEIGIVLTPPYVTKMMAEILNVNKDSRTMDLATGSAGFLISSMEIMIDDANKTFGKDTSKANKKIEEIKKEQLLGVELNAEMFTLAATNMILRGDGSSNIRKGNTFRTPEELYTNFKANRLLLNPPFSFEENGMPFIRFGLSKMEKGGLAAIIIQDSAGSGRAVSSNQEILKNNTLLASIKMPVDLFIPMAGVQTSIYVFEAGTPHDYEKTVKFIDFRNDGYKRTKRGLNEIDSPTERYQDIIKLYKAGKSAKVNENLWDIDEIYIEDFITDAGNDWNFEQHKIIDTKPKIEDFKNTVADYLAWEVSNILKSEDKSSKKA
ncbi:N-6 DNA methylase [Lagierella sp. ICN-221743]